MRFLIVIFVVCWGLPVWSADKVGAYLRVKDEIKTIEATLNSIDGLFDHVVIIHSNEPDDGSVAVMNNWCAKRPECEIHTYPHAVIAGRDARYRAGTVPYENTLAAYYIFGLQFFAPEEWVVKIDGDQIYIREQLQKTVQYIRENGGDKKRYGLRGFNTYVFKNKLVKYGLGQHNGGKDSFIVKRKYIDFFKQTKQYELIQYTENLPVYVFPEMHWFHYMKNLKSGSKVRSTDDALPKEIEPLQPVEKELYRHSIVPLIPKTSPYADIEY